jgi:hypothetical protein
VLVELDEQLVQTIEKDNFLVVKNFMVHHYYRFPMEQLVLDVL